VPVLYIGLACPIYRTHGSWTIYTLVDITSNTSYKCKATFLTQICRKCLRINLTLSLLMSYIYGAPCKTRNFNVVYIWTYVWQS
jgi:hypothetical protein